MPLIYVDNHATTRCDPAVTEAMWPWFSDSYGNAGSRGYDLGHRARDAVEAARAQVAGLIGASPKEIVWTSGATESNNLAILGAVRASGRRHVVTVATEHKAVLDPVAALAREGVHATVLPVDAHGEIAPSSVEAALRPDTALVSVMAVHNEIGVRHPIAAIGALCRARGVLFHCDAAQAPAALPIDVGAWNVDLLSLSAHKMYGPKGVGVLYVRRARPRIPIQPLVFGGAQERGLRSGTLPVALCVGMGVAAGLAGQGPGEVEALRDRLYHGLCDRLAGVMLNGPPLERRAPHNLNVSFEGVEAEALRMGLREIALSTGSACTSATLEPSHALRALGMDPERAHGAIRFGLGRFNTRAEVDQVIAQVAAKVTELRSFATLYEPERA